MKPEREVWMGRIVLALSQLKQLDLELLYAVSPSQTATPNQEGTEAHAARETTR